MLFTLPFLFWLSITIVFYTYVGYGLIVWLWARTVRGQAQPLAPDFEP